MKRLLEKFMARVALHESGCWYWTGNVDKSSGYGRLYWNKKTFLAHRLSVELFKEPIPAEKCVDHMCRNRACVNPRHLRVVSYRQNTLENSESLSAQYSKRTHCSKGHKLVLLKTKKGGRICRVCKNEGQRRRRLMKSDGVRSIRATKLSADDASEIRRLLSAGVKGREIAKQYGVNEGTISCIKLNKTWRKEQNGN
ncbi:MAG: HNH endonuclease [Bdellovibrionales bacterium]|nr:HNH endonuclease [Bdellovibrionales bacterium]